MSLTISVKDLDIYVMDSGLQGSDKRTVLRHMIIGQAWCWSTWRRGGIGSGGGGGWLKHAVMRCDVLGHMQIC